MPRLTRRLPTKRYPTEVSRFVPQFVTRWCRECHVCPPSMRLFTLSATPPLQRKSFSCVENATGEPSPSGKRVSAEVESQFELSLKAAS